MFEQVRNKFPVSDEQWSRYLHCFTRIEVAPKTVLLKEGQVSQRLFVVEQGCLRAWFNNGGRDVTFQFFFEKETVASVESFRKRLPSPVTIEAVERSIVWWIGKKDLDWIIEEIKELPVLRDAFIDALFERTFDYMKHFFSFIRDTPQQRYLNLIKERPQLIKRVPQHYIASYLGITTVHLSRIKAALARAGAI